MGHHKQSIEAVMERMLLGRSRTADPLLREDSRILDPREFCARHDYPFLVVELEQTVESFEFRTHALGGSGPGQREEVLVPIRKRGVNAFSFITLGRVGNNDVVVPSPSVSKLHAIIRRQEDGSYHITDAGSKNGTEVNGVKIDRKQGIELKVGDRIVLSGIVQGSVVDPQTAHRWLERADVRRQAGPVVREEPTGSLA